MDDTNAQAVGFRLSPQQQLLAGAGKPQVAQCAAVLDGPIDAGRLRQAIEQVIARHEILRTTFVQPPGMLTPQQVIGEDAARALCFEQDRDTEPAIEDRQALAELMSREAETEVDIGYDAPVRALLIGAETQRTLLLLSVWAACADATSLTTILSEICQAYGGTDGGEQPIQYADYAQWRHELILGDDADAQPGLAFWRQDALTRPAAPRILFTRSTAPPGDCSQAVPLQLSDIRLEELQQAAIGVGASAPAVLEAAWHTLLARLSGAGELLVAGWCDGREQVDLASAIGLYEQPAPIHSRFQQATTFAEIVDQVRRSRANAVRHQDHADAPQLSALSEQAVAAWAFHS